MEPAVDQRFRSRLGVLVVAEEDVRAPYEDLTVVGDLGLDAVDDPADRAETRSTGQVGARWTRVLRLPVDLVDLNVDGREELEELFGGRRSTHHAEARAPEAHGRLQFRKNSAVCSLVSQCKRQRERFASILKHRYLGRHAPR